MIIYLLAAIILHEAAHAAAAVLVGARVWGVVIGAGPILWQGPHVRVRAFPVAVCAAVLRDSIQQPWQAITIALAPMILSVVLLPLPTFGPLFLAVNVVNLLPLKGSDGWRALNARFCTSPRTR